jgi:hypothetical protein
MTDLPPSASEVSPALHPARMPCPLGPLLVDHGKLPANNIEKAHRIVDQKY